MLPFWLDWFHKGVTAPYGLLIFTVAGVTFCLRRRGHAGAGADRCGPTPESGAAGPASVAAVLLPARQRRRLVRAAGIVHGQLRLAQDAARARAVAGADRRCPKAGLRKAGDACSDDFFEIRLAADVIDRGIHVVEQMPRTGIALFAHHAGEFTDALGDVIGDCPCCPRTGYCMSVPPLCYLFKLLLRENGHVRAPRRLR